MISIELNQKKYIFIHICNIENTNGNKGSILEEIYVKQCIDIFEELIYIRTRKICYE